MGRLRAGDGGPVLVTRRDVVLLEGHRETERIGVGWKP